MAEWHALSKKVLFEHFVLSLFLVQLLVGGLMGCSLVNLLVGLSLLPLFSAMLLDEADFILVKVLKYVLVVKAWDRMHYLTLFSIIVIGDSINFIEISSSPLFYIVQGIKCIHVLNHVFGKLFLLLHVAFHEKSEWHVVEHIFVELFARIPAHVGE